MRQEREEIIACISAAQASGARQSKACEIIGVSAKTLQRWMHPDNDEDGRPDAERNPVNRLSDTERQRIIRVCNQPEYADLSPSKIVPTLADTGLYLASETTIYRILKEEKQLAHRLKSRSVKNKSNPTPYGLPVPIKCTHGTLRICPQRPGECFIICISSWIFTAARL